MTSQLPPAGMPILSGPPPVIESASCRQCAKQFNPLWRRANTCGHCGYEYCSNCLSDGQALMPRRRPSSKTNSGGDFGELRSAAASLAGDFRAAVGMDETALEGAARGNGYEVESVCLPCLGMLQVTAAPLHILRSLPMKRLKDYLEAYNIACVGPKEKEDFVQAVIRARNPATGCLAPEAESYYRRKSVPKNGETSKSRTSTPQSGSTSQSRTPPGPPPGPTSTPRPSPLPAVPPTRNPNSTYARPPQPSVRPQQAPPQYRPSSQRPPATYVHARPPPSTPTARPPPRSTPPPPIPTILSLVSLPRSYLSSLSIGTLKAILFENHVRVDFKQVLEKEELIGRVDELISDERKRLERQRQEEERANSVNVTLTASSSMNRKEESMSNGDSAATEDIPLESSKGSVPTGPMPEVERGLCVVCQDEEATLAVVDCGHLCMCAHCSELIMATSQECPLCRTRIVTKQRLIRIYRV